MSSRAISLVRQDAADGCVVVLTGEHDLSSVDELREAFDEASSARSVMIDLSETAFIDSAVLGALIASHRDATEHGRRWALIVGNGSGAAVRRILELTGLDAVMPVYSSRDEAAAQPFPPEGTTA
ncbi:MAG TPA: STAS domain-containing protein [Gaiellales bacterium]|nr:STAS domain-containing protein [Gaiellales bacterium]